LLLLHIVCIPSFSQEFHPRKGEIQQSASLYRSGSLASMEMQGPVLGFKVRHFRWTFRALKSLLSARPAFLRRFRFEVMWVFSNASCGP
jgi:hypothetical protein